MVIIFFFPAHIRTAVSSIRMPSLFPVQKSALGAASVCSIEGVPDKLRNGFKCQDELPQIIIKTINAKYLLAENHVHPTRCATTRQEKVGVRCSRISLQMQLVYHETRQET